MDEQGEARRKDAGGGLFGDDSPCSRYKRAQFETIWLRTLRINASGAIGSGTGGVCYLYFPAEPSPGQRRALASVGVV